MFNGYFLFLIPLPVLFGFLSRLGCRETPRPWLVTLVSILSTIGLWLAALNIDSHGSEGPMILAIMAVCFSAGTLLGEVILLLKRLTKK